MPLYRHPALSVLKIGPQAAAFLKQYTTHLIDARQTAFLTREGKTVAVARISKISEDEALLVVGQAYVEKLLSHLGKYLGLSETKIDRLDWAAYLDPHGSVPLAAGEFLIPEKAGRWILSPDKAKKCDWAEAD